MLIGVCDSYCSIKTLASNHESFESCKSGWRIRISDVTWQCMLRELRAQLILGDIKSPTKKVFEPGLKYWPTPILQGTTEGLLPL